jgi:hypothetical protein
MRLLLGVICSHSLGRIRLRLDDVKSHLRDAGAEIERGWKRLTG